MFRTGISKLMVVAILLQVAFFTVSAQVDSGALVISAVEKYSDGKSGEAAEILKKILSTDKENDAAWYYLGMCYAVQEDLDMAEDCFKSAMTIDPANFWYRYRLASVYALTSHEELTIDIYEKLLRDFPDKSDLYFDLVELYASQKEYTKAIDTIAEIEKVFGMTESLALYRFNLLIQMDRKEDAFRSLEEYNSKYSSPTVLSALADRYISEYKDSLALSHYNEALEMAPDYAPALIGKAEVLRMTRRYEEYFDVLGRYAACDESSQAKCSYLSALLKGVDPKFIKNFSRQIDGVMQATMDRHPSDSTVLTVAGFYYHSTGRPSLAKDMFRQNAEAYPESVSASAAYAEYLMFTQDWEGLVEEGLRAFDRFSNEVAFLELASVGEQRMGHYDAVVDLCDRIIDAAPADSSSTLRAWATMGDAYYEMGESEKSFKAYRKALKINPEYVYVLNNYAYCLSIKGKSMKKAYQMSRKTIEAEPDSPTYRDTFGWILYLLGKHEEAKTHFKHAILYGGKDSVVILDHYAEVLYALGEYDRAMVYWNKALLINNGEIEDLEERIEKRKSQIKKKK